MVDLINRHIGTVSLDAVIEETHQSDLSVTENPIESGAMIGDHAVLMPQVITVAGVVVDYQPQASPVSVGAGPITERLRSLTDRVSLPTDLLPFTPQALLVAQRELQSFVGKASAIQGQVQSASRALANWLPDYQPAVSSDASGGDGRVAQVYTALRSLQRSGQTLEVQTGVQLYEDMLILSLAARQTQDGSIELVVTLRELFIVETKSISGVSLPSQKRGRTSAQGAAQSRNGPTNPKAADAEKNQSMIRRITGMF